MLAVVEIGKKQYIVKKGDIVDVQRLKFDGDKISFDKVLILADDKKVKIGTPYLDKTKVEAKIEGEKKSKKILVYKCKRRKKYRKTQGHRQIFTILKITSIVASSQSPAK